MTDYAHIYVHYADDREIEVAIPYRILHREDGPEFSHVEVNGKKYPCPDWLVDAISAEIEATHEPDDLRIP